MWGCDNVGHELATLPRGRGHLPPRARVRKADERKTREGGSHRVVLFGQMRELALYRGEVLRHRGFSVITPRTYSEAVAAIESGNLDALILSYTLPNEIVHELAERLKQNCPRCPLIAISQAGKFDPRIAPDEIVIGDEGPTALIEALQRALHQQLQ